MMILAIETSAEHVSVAVLDHDDVRAALQVDAELRHAEIVVDRCGAVLAEAGIAWSDLTHIAVCIGPGSFAGVRAGVAAARGLALSLDIPAIGVSALEALGVNADAPTMAAIVGPRDTVFAQAFDAAGTALAPPDAMTAEQAATLATNHDVKRIVGSAAPAIAAHVPDRFVIGDATLNAVAVGTVARARIADNRAAPAEPLYLRGANAAPAKPSLLMAEG